jgi:hypothetical protein
MRPPRASFSILAGKSLHISYFVELRADIALSTGLIHRIPGDISCCFRAAHACIWRRFFASHAPAVVLVDNSTMKEQEQQQQDEAAVSS